MKRNNLEVTKTLKYISVSLLLYLSPVILMFIYFRITGTHPWVDPKPKPMFAFLRPIFNQLFAWGITAILVFVGIIELFLGLYKRRWTSNERALDIAGLVLPRVLQPVSVFFTAIALPHLLPTSRDLFLWVPFFWGFFIILISYDLSLYWLHRLHHQVSFLWGFHRAHHSAPYMGVWVERRTNVIYAVLFSPIYLIIALSYLGLGEATVLFAALKSFVAMSAHSTIRWDKPFYTKKWLRPFAWVLERTISTPTTHHAHHAATNDDGIGNNIGNFGNTLFIWDVIFGTALITRKIPTAYGVKNYQQEEWYSQLLWPILKSSKKGSELSVDESDVTF